MEKLIYLLLAIIMVSCQKEDSQIMKVQITGAVSGANYNYVITSKPPGSANAAVLYSAQGVAVKETIHEFAPQAGSVINVKVNSNNASSISLTVIYKGQDLDLLSCYTGTTASPCSFDKSYTIPN